MYIKVGPNCHGSAERRRGCVSLPQKVREEDSGFLARWQQSDPTETLGGRWRAGRGQGDGHNDVSQTTDCKTPERRGESRRR